MINILENCPVPILQEPWEFAKLVEIYRAHAPAKVLEIGSFYGGTLWFWLNNQRYGKEYGKGWELPKAIGNLRSLTSIDYPIGPSDGRHEEMLRCRAMWPEWTKDVEFHDLHGDSHSAAVISKARAIYPDNDVDFLFIDGDHSYAGVKADYDNYAPLVRPGGLIVFHDVCGLPEVALFWNEVRQGQRAMEICGHPGGWGIGIIEKQ